TASSSADGLAGPCAGRDSSECFFFQAEDGIRDGHVTGVQTCALPISAGAWAPRLCREIGLELPARVKGIDTVVVTRPAELARPRSEERRVGKECRSRG